MQVTGLPPLLIAPTPSLTNPMSSHQIAVEVDYHQFYLWDPTIPAEAPEDYTDEDVRRMVKVADHVVVVQPVRNGTVPVGLTLFPADPGFPIEEFDHVVECSLDLPGGQLQVHECMGGAVLDLEVQAGTYRVRVLFHSLATLDEDHLDGKDSYTVQLWPGEQRGLTVVKQWAD